MTRTDVRVAVIEDDADLAFTIRLNLEREGYSVTHFDNGHEGLLAVQQGGFDFLILDLNLPDLDGFTICRELRRNPASAKLPILMLTARTSEADRSRDSSSARTTISSSRSASASSSRASRRSCAVRKERTPTRRSTTTATCASTAARCACTSTAAR